MERLERCLKEVYPELDAMARSVWASPELGLAEYEAARLYRAFFADRGFRVSGVDGLETAVIAEFGQGAPVIGVIGEYDALPGLSQALSAEKEPAVAGGAGHGCGHNLLGAAAAGACVATACLMREEGLGGTVRFYGCPAEELGVGKVRMLEAGVFDDADLCLAWHPGMFNAVTASSLSALIKAEFFFEGTSAHAGAHPEEGRSALDAVELMNVGANYLREHIPPGAKLHYVITNGGDQPNIVPAKASVRYMVRAPRTKTAHEVFERLCDVARGATLMTGTSVRFVKESDNYHTLNNRTLEDFMEAVYAQSGDLVFSQEEQDFAAAIQSSLGVETDPPLDGRARSMVGRGESFGASSDLGVVTHKVPTVQCSATCFPGRVPLHTWQATACAGSMFGVRGARYMARVLAYGAARLLGPDIDVIRAARQEFNQKGQQEYLL